MANTGWFKGMKAVNPNGRPKHSAKTVKGMCERFIRRNMTPTKLQAIHDTLKAKEQLEMYEWLLPYVLAKPIADSLSSAEIDELYQKLEQTVRDATTHKKAS